ncbi:MAG: hypothetical protein ABI355_15730 [Solirubrobacteraceae bacterium]
MREHNELYGIAFSIVEFLLVGIVAALIAVGFGASGRPAGAVIASGIAANSMLIVAVGIAAWRRGERGTPIGQVFSARYRAHLVRCHPQLPRDTCVVASATLAPFLVVVMVVVELARRVRRAT